jgi:hypothetical protein
MGGNGEKKKGELPAKDKKPSEKPAPPRREQEQDYEDGDIATPKRDRYGDDDQPL